MRFEPDQPLSLELHKSVELFLYQEATLLQEHRYTEWLELFDDAATYRLPVREAVQPAVGGPPAVHTRPLQFELINDTKSVLADRVARLNSGLALSEQPPSITQRMITNIVARPVGPDTVSVTCNFLVHQCRHEHFEDTFIGGRTDVLRRDGDGWVILSRDLALASPVLAQPLAIFL
jgi:3-phenylpropionate/cinnamic acid dioxygenase small subunit